MQSHDVDDLIDRIVARHGKTKANDLIGREMSRIYNKLFNRELILAVKEVACCHVLNREFDGQLPDELKQRLISYLKT